MKNLSHKIKKKKHQNSIYLICWLVIPLLIIFMLILDGIGLYPFNRERLLVIGAFLFVMLIPFVKEITVQNISIKKENKPK